MGFAYCSELETLIRFSLTNFFIIDSIDSPRAMKFRLGGYLPQGGGPP